MSVKINHRQFRKCIESLLARGCYTPYGAAFWSEFLRRNDMWRQSDVEPVKIVKPDGLGAATWLYKNTEFDVRACSDFPDEDIKLFIRDALDKERKKVERLRMRYGGIEAEVFRRVTIPDDVRMFVWQRDGGACVTCGSNQNLEYDHIIPVSKGGSSTARNLQLLCTECNRSKSNHI